MSNENPKVLNILPHRPKPITTELEVLEYASHISPESAVNELLEGNYVLVVDLYGSGLKLLEALKKRLDSKNKKQTFQEQRANRDLYRTLSHHILLEVSDNKLTVRKAPFIGWLKELYSDMTDFVLPFPEVQGLNSSWQWYEKGLTIPGLDQKLHPFYGTYFPTRFEHIELFDQYLSKYGGSKERAIDIGIGSGVLSFLMQKHGFQEIIGTDSNPNALIGVQRTEEKNKAIPPIKLRHGDLFARSNKTFDLVVFNPPWIPIARKTKGLDAAVYYDTDLFPRFFNRTEGQLNKNGKVVLIFSNLAQLMNEKTIHPIAHELETNQRFKKVELIKMKAQPQSDKTNRAANWREDEVVELWVLELR